MQKTLVSLYIYNPTFSQRLVANVFEHIELYPDIPKKKKHPWKDLWNFSIF